jgi:PAS domain S-box-containing protein
MESEKLQRRLTILEAENSALRAQVNQRQSIEATLTTILKGTAAVTGDAFFQALVQSLAEVLNAKYIMLGELAGKERDSIRTLAYWKIDGPAPNFEYELWGSPCATVINNTLQYYPQNTWQLFPDDKPLVEKRVECYLGVPLLSSTGETLGILVVMDDKLSETIANFVPLISTFAARAAAELERKQNEESMRESEQRYRLLVEQSSDAIFLIRNSRFLLVNKRFYDLFEVTPDIIFAPDFNILTLIDASSAADITFRLQKSYHTTMPPERFEVIAQTINGRSLPIEVSISFVEFKEGPAVQGILRDLTRQKQIEAQQQDQRELAEALHEIGMAFSASLEIDVILDLLLEQVERVIPYDSANVILIDGAQTRLVRARGYEKFGIHIDLAAQPTSHSLTETPTFRTIIDSGKPLLIPDITRDERWQRPEQTPHIRSWASAPILVDGKVIAFLSVSKAEPNFYTAAHGSRLAAFAAQASLAWQNAHLLTAVSQRAHAFKATRDILRALNAALDVQEAFPVIARHLEDLIGCQRITIAQLDSTQEWVTFYGLQNGRLISDPAFRLHISETNAAANIMAGQPHIVPDITTELDQKAARALYAENIRAYVSLPLNDSQKIFGAFTAGWETAADFHEDQLPILQQIVDAIALGMERSRLFKTSQRRSQELNLLYQVMSAAASGHSKEEILETSCVEIAHFLQISHITLSLLDTSLPAGKPQSTVATIGAQFTAPGEMNLRGQQLSFEVDSYLLGELARLTAPVSIESVAEFPLSQRMRRLAGLYDLVSALIIPIMLRGAIIGIIGIGHREKRTFTEAEIQLLQTVADELGRVLEIASLYEQLRVHAAELEVRVSERTWELADANERLKELDRMKSRFVSDVSHELRTPVTNLKLYLDLLERRGAEQLDQYLPILQKQADRLGQLIQDILDLSRLNLGHAKLKFASLDLNEVVMEVVIAHEPRAESAGLGLASQPQPDLPPVWGERNQLAQVITNLLSNAIIYSTAGTIQVKTAVSPTEPLIVLEVSDTGIGIPPEDVPHLFDRFYRGQKTRQSNIPGTGLGLAIAHEIVSIHNGRLELESAEGKGSTFRVFLPIYPQTEA